MRYCLGFIAYRMFLKTTKVGTFFLIHLIYMSRSFTGCKSTDDKLYKPAVHPRPTTGRLLLVPRGREFWRPEVLCGQQVVRLGSARWLDGAPRWKIWAGLYL